MKCLKITSLNEGKKGEKNMYKVERINRKQVGIL